MSDFTQTEAAAGAVAVAVNGAEASKPEVKDSAPAAPERARDPQGRYIAGVRSAETEAKEREGWAKVLERERGEKPAPAKPAEPAKKDESTPAAPAEGAGEKPKETAAQGKGQEKPPLQEDPAYEQAVKALRLDGYRTEDLSVLGPERVKALGVKAAERQASFSQKLDELSRKASAAPAAPQAGEQAGTPASQPPDLKAAVKGFADAVGLSTEEAEPALTKFAEAVVSPLRAELDQTKKLADSMMSVLVTMEAIEARGKLPEEIRGLTDDAEFKDKVVPRALSLWSKRSEGEYESFVDALADAQVIVAAPRIRSEAASVRARKAEQREHGQLSSIEQRTPHKPRSVEDRQRAAFQVIARGGTEEEARAAYGA